MEFFFDKTVKVYCWTSQLKANCFWWTFLKGTRKNELGISVSAFSVPADTSSSQMRISYLIQ